MKKSAAAGPKGVALQRFVEATLCEIADGIQGARAVVDPPDTANGKASKIHYVERVNVEFDIAVNAAGGNAGNAPEIRAIDGAKANGGASRVRFTVPLTVPVHVAGTRDRTPKKV